MTENDGFIEYKKLLLDWHETDKKFQENVTAQLTALQTDVTEIKAQRALGRIVSSFFVPGLVAGLVALLVKLWK